MKSLTLLNDSTNIKLGDTGTLIQFKASINDTPVFLKEGQTATFRIKNDLGFLKSIDANTNMNGYVFEFDTSELIDLPVGSYQVELAITKSEDNVIIFPDKGFVNFDITENALSVTGEQLPVMSLEAFKDEVDKYVSTKVAETQSEITNDFQKYVDSLTDNTIATANKASQDATKAVSTAQAVSAVANGASTMANDALNSINSGLYLDMAKSLTQANTSKNLVINSNMQTKETGIHPYSDWHNVWGWTYSNGGSPTRKNWYGYETIKANGIAKDIALLSQGVYAGTQRSATIYSARVHYRIYGTLTDTIYTFYLEYAYQADFQNSQKITLGTVDKSSSSDNWIIKENITVPEGYNWIRLRVEANTTKPESYLFIGGPMINYGSKALAYVPSNQSGQRISSVEQTVDAMQQQISQLTLQLAQSQMAQVAQANTDLSTLTSNGKWSFNNTTVSNAPGGAKTLTGTLEVTNNGTNGVQTVVDTVADIMFWRTWNGSNFNKWHAVANDSSIISPA